MFYAIILNMINLSEGKIQCQRLGRIRKNQGGLPGVSLIKKQLNKKYVCSICTDAMIWSYFSSFKWNVNRNSPLCADNKDLSLNVLRYFEVFLIFLLKRNEINLCEKLKNG